MGADWASIKFLADGEEHTTMRLSKADQQRFDVMGCCFRKPVTCAEGACTRATNRTQSHPIRWGRSSDPGSSRLGFRAQHWGCSRRYSRLTAHLCSLATLVAAGLAASSAGSERRELLMPWLWGVLRLVFKDGAGGGRHVPISHVLHGPTTGRTQS